jgi:hypothetical protein
MTRRLVFVFAALFLVLAACGGGVEENGGADVTVDTKPDTPDTTAGTATTAPDDGGDEGIPPGQDPRNILGDDEALNTLANQCFEGDMDACDQLFSDTPVDSDLEAYAQTCGGRIEEQDGAPDCATRFVAVGDPQQPGDLTDDPTLSDSSAEEISRFGDLADQCFDGDFAACDDLFLETPIDSDFEAYGRSCGGRLEEGVGGECESNLGSGSEPGDTATTLAS